MRSNSKQPKIDEMKKRVQPINNIKEKIPEINNNENPEKTGQASGELERKINIEDKNEDISLEKTTDILNQINEYLENEKKNLNKNI